jgi:uncharacterized membrane protein
VAFWLVILGGMAIAVFTPPMLGGDERDHFTRAYQVATGDVLTHRHNGAYGANLPVGVSRDIADITKRALSSRDRTSFLHDFSRPAPGGPARFVDLNQTASYGPGAYAPYVVAIAAGRVARLSTLTVFYLARFAGVLTYAVLLALAVRRLPVHRWLLVACGLTPVAIGEATTVSADGLTMVLSFLVVAEALYLALETADGVRLRRPLAEVAGACAVLALAKPPYIAFALLLLVPAWRHRSRLLWPLLAICGTAFALAGVWAFYQSGHSLPQDEPHRWLVPFPYAFHDLNVGAQSLFVFTHPVNFLIVIGRTFARAGWSFPRDLLGRLSLYQLSSILIACSAIIIAGSALVADYNDDRKHLGRALRAWLAAVTVGIALTLFFIAYTNWNSYRAPIVEAFNARYLLPLLPPLALAVLPTQFKFSRRWQGVVGGAVTGGLIVVLVLAVIGLQRFHFSGLPITSTFKANG